jgi:putative nucleotidyltransferase with HDIG domain
MLAALCALIEARDPYTRGHSTRTAALGVALAERLGWGGALVGAVRLGGLLHDIGKVTVSEHVLRKPGPLEPVELDAIRRHPVTGAHLVRLTPETRAALPACSSTMSAGTGAAIRSAAPASRSRRRRVCSPLPTRSTR